MTSLLDSMNGDGRIMTEVLATSSDMKVRLVIPRDTIVKNATGGNVNYLSIKKSTEALGQCEGSRSIGMYYTITPEGTTFDPGATLIFEYETACLPQDVSEDKLYMALWDPVAREWIDVEGEVDTASNTVSIFVEHLSTYALMAHARPALCAVDGLSLTAAEASPGEGIVASVAVSNTGDYAGTCELELKLDNVVVQTRSIELEGGASETLSFALNSGIVGEHMVSVGGFSQTFTVKTVSSPAFFTASDLRISPVSVDYGEQTNISVAIVNDGEFAASYEAELVIDDALFATREVTLGAGISEIVSFDVVFERVGVHIVSLCGLEAVFQVRAPAAPELNNEPQLSLVSFSIAPTYNEATKKLVFARITYRLSEDSEDFPEAGLMLTAYCNGEYLEQVPLLTLSQMNSDGKTGVLSYVPAGGWSAGEYAFYLGLYDGETLVQESELQTMMVNPESITTIESWWTLGAVIGVASILILVLVGVVIYRKRDMLKGE